MSDTDSFIEEVSEEVRRDRLWAMARRYGWIVVLAVVLLVGGAVWHELRKSREDTAAQAFGDEILGALSNEDRAARADALAGITAPTAGSDAILSLLTASEESEDNPAEAASRLLALADRSDVPLVYQQLATLKAVMVEGAGLSVETRQARLNALTGAGGMLRLLAEEQLAMIEIEQGNTDAAISRLQAIVLDAEVSPGLRTRATQVIVALGGDPEG